MQELPLIRVCCSGGFDPLHEGHLELFEKAKALGYLIVIVNSNHFLLKKKGCFKETLEQRMDKIREYADEVIASIDTTQTVVETLRMVKPDIFANGGDRVEGNLLESLVCKEIGCKEVFGLGEKIRSSSDYITHSA